MSEPHKTPSAPSEKAVIANLPEYRPPQTGTGMGSDLPPAYSSVTGGSVVDNSQVGLTNLPGALPSQPDLASGGSWTPATSSKKGCLPGLEALDSAERVIVRPTIDVFQMVPGCQYAILNDLEQQLYTAREDLAPGDQRSVGELRFMQILDSNRTVAFRVNRHSNSKIFSFGQRLEVWTNQGLIGKVEHDFSLMKQQFRVMDASGLNILAIQGSFNTVTVGGGMFEVVLSGLRVGTITLQSSGIFGAGMSHSYGIIFPENCDVKVKATIVGVVFLLDYLFRQMINNHTNSRRRRRH